MTKDTQVYALLNAASQDLLAHYIMELSKATAKEDTARISVINSIICCLAPQLFVEKQLK